MDYIKPEELKQLNIGDRFSLDCYEDIYEFLGQPKELSYSIRHLDGQSFSHNTSLWLGSSAKVKRISCSLVSHYRQSLINVLNRYLDRTSEK